MPRDLLLFGQLVIFLVGALLYGFLARELFGRREVLRGRAVRWLAACLTVWYAGCLIDAVLAILLPPGWNPGAVGTVLDLLRGFAWLASFPLLAHAVWSTSAGASTSAPALLGRREGSPPSPLWLAPGYLTLSLFVLPAARALAERRIVLVDLAREVYPLVVAHALVASSVAAWMLVRSLRLAEDRRLRQLLRWLLAALAATVGLLALGGWLLRSPSTWGDPSGRLAAAVSGLCLGLTFLYFVQRYDLLRLSLSYRSLRHFLAILALVLLATFAGPAVGAEDSEVFRRLVAWGLVLALAAGALYGPLGRWALARSPRLRRLAGRSVTPAAIERLTRPFRSLDVDEAELRRLAAREVSAWLTAEARWLEGPAGVDREIAHLWRAFREPEAAAFNRRGAPTAALLTALVRRELHAVFPLRVAGELDGLLGLGRSATGGGYRDGEMEAVQLVVRQLAAAIEVRRLVAERLAGERRLAERERLSLLGLVAASLAHELKNPLSAIKALAQTVREELEATEGAGEQAEDLGHILEQIDRLGEVAREVLDFARPSKGGEVELTALARSTLYVLDHEARRRGLVIDAGEVGEVGRVAGTPAAWQTVLFNLVHNAVSHAPRGSTVRLRLARDGDAVVFATDNGAPALEPAVAEHLFEPFVSDGGTGLGLTLVAQRLAELGGEVAVRHERGRIVFEARAPALGAP